MAVDETHVPKTMKILAIDDEETVVKLYQSLISEMGHKIIVAKTGREAIEKVEKEKIDLVLLDLRLPDIDGSALLGQLNKYIENAPVIIITAHPTLESSIDAIRTGGVYDYIIKPFGSDDFKRVVRRAVEKALLMHENKRLLKKLEVANQALTERVDELEKIASEAVNSQVKITKLAERIRQLERK